MDSQKPGGSTLGLVEQYLGVIVIKTVISVIIAMTLIIAMTMMIVINIIVIFIDIVTKNTLE